MFPNQATPNESNRLLKVFLHTGFLISGVMTVLIGQILPILSNRLALDDRQAGDLFIAQFSGSLVGTLLTQTVARRVGFGGAASLGFLTMLVGVSGLNSDNWIVSGAAFVVNGFGIGITLPAINMLTVELNPTRITPALNFLNFFWGVGAIFCKTFVDFFGTQTSIFTPALILSVLLFINGLAIFLAARRNEPPPIFEDSAVENFTPIWTTALAWLITAFNFVHVGFESGIGGWITTYAARLPNQSSAVAWFSPTFAYFLFFVAGRFVAPLYSRILNENRILLLGLFEMTLGVLILLFADSILILIVGAAIAGFGTSAIFPTNMARFTKTFGATATRRATPLFVSGTLGSALTTWLIGYVAANYQNLRVGMFVLLASCFLLIVLQVYLYASRSRATVST